LTSARLSLVQSWQQGAESVVVGRLAEVWSQEVTEVV